MASVVHAQHAHYTEIRDWFDPPDGRPNGAVADVYPDPDGGFWIAERCGANRCTGRDDLDPIHKYDASGKWIRGFGAGLFIWPHGIYVDADGNVWVTDADGADGKGFQVFKFSPDGEILMRLGEAGVAGSGPAQFSSPTAVAVADNGDIFVSDGHNADVSNSLGELAANNRIVKFSSDGTFIKSWGSTGTENGQFRVPHDIEMDPDGRLFVADRDNNRVQIFDQDGNFIDAWTHFGKAGAIDITDNYTLYVSDNLSGDEANPGWVRGIRIGDARYGSVNGFIPEPGFDPGQVAATGPHGISVMPDGAILGGDVGHRTLRKFVPSD